MKGTKILQNRELMYETMGIVENNIRAVTDMLRYAEKVEGLVSFEFLPCFFPSSPPTFFPPPFPPFPFFHSLPLSPHYFSLSPFFFCLPLFFSETLSGKCANSDKLETLLDLKQKHANS